MLPLVKSITENSGYFLLGTNTAIGAADPATQAAARLLASYMRTALGSAPPVRETGSIVLELDSTGPENPEAYRLTVAPDRVTLRASRPDGLLRGIQSLRQMLPAEALRPASGPRDWKLSAVDVTDEPDLAWRGVMLDVARHFFDKDEVLRLIDLIAFHRLNVLHLHLTDDQGWRVPIDRYPRLIEVGSVRRAAHEGEPGIPPGRASGPAHRGAYSHADLTEIVAFAAERGILVVPEIDMPGHVQAAVAAYPELGIDPEPVPEVWPRWGINDLLLNPADPVAEFFENVLAEVLQIFPSPYIHIGGDECPTDRWAQDPQIVARAAALGLADVSRLHGWFMGRMARFVKARGRIPVGWDELAGADPGTVVMAWNTGEGIAVRTAEAGHPVVLAPSDRVYFDLYQSPSGEPRAQKGVITLADAYSFDPRAGRWGADLRDSVLGAQCQLWTEYVSDRDQLDYMLFPRLCAFAERVWSGWATDFSAFVTRLPPHLERLEALGVAFRPPDAAELR